MLCFSCCQKTCFHKVLDFVQNVHDEDNYDENDDESNNDHDDDHLLHGRLYGVVEVVDGSLLGLHKAMPVLHTRVHFLKSQDISTMFFFDELEMCPCQTTCLAFTRINRQELAKRGSIYSWSRNILHKMFFLYSHNFFFMQLEI